MKSSIALLMALPLMLAGCGDGATNTAAPATPVAAATATAGQSWIDTVVQTPEGGYRVGNPDAPLKLVEYGARSCPGCGQFARESFTPLMEKYVGTGKVSFEFRDFLVHGAPDIPGALLAACAGPGPFFALTEAMYANQNDYLDRLQKLTSAEQQQLSALAPPQAVTLLAEKGGLIELARQRGIPEAKARECLGSQPAIEALAKRTEKWSTDGTVGGTPTFYLNGERVENASWTGVEEALKAGGA